MTRFIVEDGVVSADALSAGALRVWLAGHDPLTGQERGRPHLRAESDLLLDATLNHRKSYSIAVLLHAELAVEFEALQDRIRDRTIVLWQQELNARRGHGGLIREDISRLEVVELQHRRSRALDPHIHRHLWLNVKVRGEDGQWTNVDSRVAMKFHTVINAEGELAARTDPRWVTALARHGYTIDAGGEIAELAALVAPLSRRSAQIEANRAHLIAEWQSAHAGAAPSVAILQQIDRRAWAVARPNKPVLLDEESWERAVRDELHSLDPSIGHPRIPAPLAATPLGDLDVDLLAAMAVVDADERSRSSSGRFGLYDLHAGALRALSRTGVIVHRSELDDVHHRIIATAMSSVVRLTDEHDVPGHVKQYMATETVRSKVRLARDLDLIATPGPSFSRADLRTAATRVLDADRLDASQLDAASAIAGHAGLVTVTGPAGAGKTTMLRLAHHALRSQRRRMLVVTPTRKASSIAAEEIGAAATSVHALLHDHGFRWAKNDAGAQVWTRLVPGDTDPTTCAPYPGVTKYPLHRGDRIVVDEAGMMDLQTAEALTTITFESRVGLALVGDPHQAAPVGHTGAMAIAIRATSAAIELDTVHRFRDPAYAALTLQLRNPRDLEDAVQIAQALTETGHVTRVDSTDAAREAMVDAYFQARSRAHTVALVCGTNSEVDAVNTLIQDQRVTCGQLDPRTVAWGRGEQRLLEGDTVQTRRNDRVMGVENRATWVIHRIHADRIDLISPVDAGEHRWVTHDYAADHVQLAYASTVHGIQGDTTHTAIVGPDVSAAGLYVGLTRGRHHNTAITIAHTDQAAINQLAPTMLRGHDETSITHSVNAVRDELRRSARDAPQTQALPAHEISLAR
ncbi:ATP-dependent RecD-like DNA helicase [Microbacterium lemovicicum]|uniref:ATP-dependent RecD-like DNA helicase n=1 Tax=Microbacterium lemovicicum TaxID=1072463 RepID=A0A3Q9IY61_9MICO|nr:AAA family ATPase [Microbacterium lemovicicum]AZS35736.1 ATP-dependent RecD-like DNA helicase [Microbacterium lemovicicum]